eukprot:COSAG01_NODE_16303_length_1248_cov_1.859878_2_plen_146_part_00
MTDTARAGAGAAADTPSVAHARRRGDSGYWRAVQGRHASPTGTLAPELNVGDVVLFDLRVRHRGAANASPDPRPLLYISYVHEWFQDRVNFASAQSADFDSLPSDAARKLFSRLVSTVAADATRPTPDVFGLSAASNAYTPVGPM